MTVEEGWRGGKLLTWKVEEWIMNQGQGGFQKTIEKDDKGMDFLLYGSIKDRKTSLSSPSGYSQELQAFRSLDRGLVIL